MASHSEEYKAPAHKSTTVRGSYMSDDSAGVQSGLSSRKDFDSEVSSDLKINNETSMSGNPRQCIKQKEGYSVSEKGHSFEVGC